MVKDSSAANFRLFWAEKKWSCKWLQCCYDTKTNLLREILASLEVCEILLWAANFWHFCAEKKWSCKWISMFFWRKKNLFWKEKSLHTWSSAVCCCVLSVTMMFGWRMKEFVNGNDLGSTCTKFHSSIKTHDTNVKRSKKDYSRKMFTSWKDLFLIQLMTVLSDWLNKTRLVARWNHDIFSQQHD